MTDFNQKTHDTDVGSHGGQSRQMMEVFENQEFGSIRVLQEAGKTFFCASDVAKALGYVNPYAVIDERYKSGLPVIITTNLKIAEIRNPQDVAYARIYSRILEMCTPVRISGEDRRKSIGKEKQQVVKEVLDL